MSLVRQQEQCCSNQSVNSQRRRQCSQRVGVQRPPETSELTKSVVTARADARNSAMHEQECTIQVVVRSIEGRILQHFQIGHFLQFCLGECLCSPSAIFTTTTAGHYTFYDVSSHVQPATTPSTTSPVSRTAGHYTFYDVSSHVQPATAPSTTSRLTYSRPLHLLRRLSSHVQVSRTAGHCTFYVSSYISPVSTSLH